MRISTAVITLIAVAVAGCGTESVGLPSAPELDRASHHSNSDRAWSAPINIGPVVNTAFSEFDAFITRDGRSLYFVTGMNRAGGIGMRDLWVSERASPLDAWGPAVNLGPTVNSVGHDSHPMVSHDGHYLYFSSNRAGFGGFDLFVSWRRDTHDNLGWEAPINLGAAINSSADETGLTIAAGLAYFSSSRLGGMDIYTARARGGAEFSDAVIAEDLSTPFQDIDPSLSHDGREIFFGSDRTGTFGNIDLWVSTRNGHSERWSPAENLGANFNTAFFDGGPALSFDGSELYFQSAFRLGNIGGPMFDIWVARRE